MSARYRSYPLIWRLARQLARDLRCTLTFDVWKYAMALTVLADHWQDHQLSPRTFALIGDGYGFLGALIRRYLPQTRLYCIDIPQTLVFQRGTHAIDLAEVFFVQPQNIEDIHGMIDCAINIASMQEMNAFTIEHHFRFLRQRSHKHSRFYCVNRVEKMLPGGEVVRFAEYPWHKDDDAFIDGRCPYYTHFLGKQTRLQGPRFLGLRVPFVNYFDGDIEHRLVRLRPM